MASLAPIVGLEPTVLILGSMPSQISLEQQRYYANPNNAFWWLMSQMLNFSLDASYQQRIENLKDSGYAVWDVLYDCERKGSLDGNIIRATEQANDIAAFIKRYPGICKIGFNGRAAQTIFARHNNTDCLKSTVQHCLLPSTSSAHARMNKYEKLQVWRLELGDSSNSSAK